MSEILKVKVIGRDRDHVESILVAMIDLYHKSAAGRISLGNYGCDWSASELDFVSDDFRKARDEQ